MRLYITKGELSLTLPLKSKFARKRDSKLRVHPEMMKCIRRDISERIERVKTQEELDSLVQLS